ncbi:MAG: hypothetical protein GX846_10660 [Deltaproteobacteria bacterium]|nr:hypothetical protein [Deltaproteobacteria bacterium]
MALDEPTENDEIIKDNGVSYLIDKNLLEQVKPINVDFVDGPRGSGFSISSNLPKSDACSSCTSC